MTELPWRGLGLSSNLGAADVPHPYRLLERHPGLFDFVEYSAPLELERARTETDLFAELWQRRAEVPALFHPVHLNLFGPTLEGAERLAALDAQARAVGSAWVGNDVAWWHTGEEAFPGYLYVSPPLTAEGVASCVRHALHVQAALSVPLALENPAVIARRGELHVLDFMGTLHARTGLPLVLDVGHLWSHQLAAGLAPTAGFDGFPFEQVIEIHIAGGVVTQSGARRFYADDHTQPVREELFALLEDLIPRCRGLRALTYEGDGHPPHIAERTLRRLRTLLPASPPGPFAPLPPRDSGADAVEVSSGTADLFASSYVLPTDTDADGAQPTSSTVDPVAERAERDWRLAVLGDALERDWPLSRWLVAGARSDLQRFAADDRFAGIFVAGEGTVSQAFGAWARREVLTRRLPGAMAALSLETWAHTVLVEKRRPQSAGPLALAPGVAVGTFPADLSELLFGLRALKRHLQARALATGIASPEALEGLEAVGRRAGPGPWPVAVLRAGGRLELLPLTVRQLRVLQEVDRAGPDAPPPGDAALVEELLRAGLLRRA